MARTTPPSPDLNNLAVLLQATNRLAEAEPLDRRALAIDEESMAPTTPPSPSASTTWRHCCGPPTGWTRPSRYRGAPCRS